MSDLISRQAAICTVDFAFRSWDTDDIDDLKALLISCYESLPSAGPYDINQISEYVWMKLFGEQEDFIA